MVTRFWRDDVVRAVRIVPAAVAETSVPVIDVREQGRCLARRNEC